MSAVGEGKRRERKKNTQGRQIRKAERGAEQKTRIAPYVWDWGGLDWGWDRPAITR